MAGSKRDSATAPVVVDPAEEPAQPVDGDRRAAGAQQAMYFYGVTRARGWRPGPLSRSDDEEVVRVRYRDIEALVRHVSYEVPPLDDEHVQVHQRAVDRAMRRGTVLPAPYGIVFRGRRQLIKMLQDQYLVFDEGLSFLDGHWEVRLHITAASGADNKVQLLDLATEVYTELRRFARAAVPFPRQEKRLLSAAFLVERTSWLDFMERAEDMGAAHPTLSFDITGPWPPYDFVRIAG
jgi:hypothetical protein